MSTRTFLTLSSTFASYWLYLVIFFLLFSSSTFSAKKKKPPSYYEVLALEPTATEKEIKKAFFKLAIKYHPDKNKDNPDQEKISDLFAQIAYAYEILSDPIKKARYDKLLTFGQTVYNEEIFKDEDQKLKESQKEAQETYKFQDPKQTFDKAKTMQEASEFWDNVLVAFALLTFLIFSIIVISVFVLKSKFYQRFIRRKHEAQMKGKIKEMHHKKQEDNVKIEKQVKERLVQLQQEKQKKKERFKKIDQSKVTKWTDDEKEEESEKIDEAQEESEELEIVLDSFYCFACRKKFKSKQQWINHEKSKKHKQQFSNHLKAGRLTKLQLEKMEQQSLAESSESEPESETDSTNQNYQDTVDGDQVDLETKEDNV